MSKEKDYNFEERIINGESHYYVLFMDNCKNYQEVEVTSEVYNEFQKFSKKEKSQENYFDRHIEHAELTDWQMYKRKRIPEKTLEEKIIGALEIECLIKALTTLSETSKRRFIKHYIDGYTYLQIANQEGCTKMAVKFSCDNACKKIKKFFED